MSWNATVDRLRGQAQQYGLASDYVTAKLLYEAVDEIERIARERDEARAQADGLAKALGQANAQNEDDERDHLQLADDYEVLEAEATRLREAHDKNIRKAFSTRQLVGRGHHCMWREAAESMEQRARAALAAPPKEDEA